MSKIHQGLLQDTDNPLDLDCFGNHHIITNWSYHNPECTSPMVQSDRWPLEHQFR
ncbi:hypothetical protein JG687_00010534 [Phytophthora cactorum]|uniref:Uncharacterized protein n=1 Tax=Phytophthora cactorum TaxID=29920 RepID=A0A8T1U9R0_9STRA|nr:hypothetical protein JG687_00010534 [Phytophthora cactorum]